MTLTAEQTAQVAQARTEHVEQLVFCRFDNMTDEQVFEFLQSEEAAHQRGLAHDARIASDVNATAAYVAEHPQNAVYQVSYANEHGHFTSSGDFSINQAGDFAKMLVTRRNPDGVLSWGSVRSVTITRTDRVLA